jgi:hypothetical protein
VLKPKAGLHEYVVPPLAFKVVVEPKGTSGKECLDLMKFLDKIPGFVIKETTPNKDMKDEMKDFNFEENKTK